MADNIIGFIVNPIAGMGGAVGLKGTDGTDVLDEALKRGAVRKATDRARETLKTLRAMDLGIRFLTCAGEMGASLLRDEGFEAEEIHFPNEPTTAYDTRKASEALVESEAQLILFCGGDGTARDVVSVVGTRLPVVGIPSGVKMHSSVFALTPSDAAHLVQSFLATGALLDAEVMDVDEDDFRDGVVSSTLFGLARVPGDSAHAQPTKSSYSGGDAEAEAEELAMFVAEVMREGTVYLLGPGSTTAHVARAIGQDKTPLGVDAYLDGKIIGLDLSEQDILRLLLEHDVVNIVVTPIGSQGFILGRGNQQLSQKVVRSVGVDNIVVIATPTKVRDTPILRVDTGDPVLDSEMRRPVKVLTGYRRRKLMRVA
ncbi:MAG: ATP-NAD kinase family protein [Candidatus Thermoplasmatota archaeon]|nr:ATP-NAD kinase family protein [Candidatus Thermoplasmatota archaeon]